MATTASMTFGSMKREFFLQHYDPQRRRLEIPRSDLHA
jgi:hypothetical protein